MWNIYIEMFSLIEKSFCSGCNLWNFIIKNIVNLGKPSERILSGSSFSSLGYEPVKKFGCEPKKVRL